uniref:hypothetical protein n=1 Tax=Amycolatopsis sp. CA-096443 TaxID=3239919 RepID=UPI003F4980D6
MTAARNDRDELRKLVEKLAGAGVVSQYLKSVAAYRQAERKLGRLNTAAEHSGDYSAAHDYQNYDYALAVGDALADALRLLAPLER